MSAAFWPKLPPSFRKCAATMLPERGTAMRDAGMLAVEYRVFQYVCMYVCIHACMHGRMDGRMDGSVIYSIVPLYIYIYTYTYIYIYIYTYTHTSLSLSLSRSARTWVARQITGRRDGRIHSKRTMNRQVGRD